MNHCVTLWIGELFGDVERACLRSVLRQGHSLALYCYRPPAGVPQGVEVRDASDVLSSEFLSRYGRGNVALFSDWFRYELQRQALGTWVDTDVYLLAPLDNERPYLFGEQEPGVINNAVLRLPKTSPLLPELLRPFEEAITPPWLSALPYLLSRGRELARGRADLSRLPWGSTGPRALTVLARKHGLSSEAAPPDVFYPVPWWKAAWALDPALKLEDVITQKTVALHLWNRCISDLKTGPAPEGSFLSRLQQEGRE